MRLRGLTILLSPVTLLLITGIALESCSGNKNDADILTQEQMVERLCDLYVLEQKAMRLNLAGDSAQKAFTRMEKQVFQQKGISDSIFKRSFNYYVDRPVELEKIYTALIDTLSLREQRMEITSHEVN